MAMRTRQSVVFITIGFVAVWGCMTEEPNQRPHSADGVPPWREPPEAGTSVLNAKGRAVWVCVRYERQVWLPTDASWQDMTASVNGAAVKDRGRNALAYRDYDLWGEKSKVMSCVHDLSQRLAAMPMGDRREKVNQLSAESSDPMLQAAANVWSGGPAASELADGLVWLRIRVLPKSDLPLLFVVAANLERSKGQFQLADPSAQDLEVLTDALRIASGGVAQVEVVPLGEDYCVSFPSTFGEGQGYLRSNAGLFVGNWRKVGRGTEHFIAAGLGVLSEDDHGYTEIEIGGRERLATNRMVADAFLFIDGSGAVRKSWE